MASKFICQVRTAIRARHYSKRTEQTYVYWIKNLIRFYAMKHPNDISNEEIVKFLEYLAVKREVSPSTQKTALNTFNFLYRSVLKHKEFVLPDFVRAKQRRNIPIVLERSEIELLLSTLPQHIRLCAQLMYGSGLRVMEVVRLRYQDILEERLSIIVRDGKGKKQRVTTLSRGCLENIRLQRKKVEVFFSEDSRNTDWDGVYLPYALARKYPSAPFQLGWQYFSPLNITA